MHLLRKAQPRLGFFRCLFYDIISVVNNEIEAQFLDIDKEDIRVKLKEIGAKLEKPEVLMRRVVFDLGKHAFAHVRDEGDKIVMTYKNVLDENSILGAKEVNVVVDDYDRMFGGVELCIDTWPWISTFVPLKNLPSKSIYIAPRKMKKASLLRLKTAR